MSPETIALAIKAYQLISPVAKAVIDKLVYGQPVTAEEQAAAQAETTALLSQMADLLPPGVAR